MAAVVRFAADIGLLVVTVLTRGEQDFVLPQFTLDNYLRLLDPTFLKILWESCGWPS